MTERIERMRQFFVVDKGQKAMWQKEENPYVLAEQFAAEQTPDVDRAARRLIYVLDKEEPVLFEDERIAFTRTVTTIPEIFTEAEMEELRKEHWIHEKGDVCNISVDYTKLLNQGFDAKKAELEVLRQQFSQAGRPQRHIILSSRSIFWIMCSPLPPDIRNWLKRKEMMWSPGH